MVHDGELPDSLNQPSDSSLERNRDVPGFSADDVYLYAGGMNSIFHAFLAMKAAIREAKSIMYGFPYVDTLKVLEKFGPGVMFYGHGNSDDLYDLERRLANGERFLSTVV